MTRRVDLVLVWACACGPAPDPAEPQPCPGGSPDPPTRFVEASCERDAASDTVTLRVALREGQLPERLRVELHWEDPALPHEVAALTLDTASGQPIGTATLRLVEPGAYRYTPLDAVTQWACGEPGAPEPTVVWWASDRTSAWCAASGPGRDGWNARFSRIRCSPLELDLLPGR